MIEGRHRPTKLNFATTGERFNRGSSPASIFELMNPCSSAALEGNHRICPCVN